MAGKRNDLLGRLADLSEEAMQRLSDVPGGERALGALNALRERTDELQRRVRGLEGLEQRLEALERKVDRLAKAQGVSGAAAGATARKTTSTRTTSTKSSGAKKSQPAEE